MGLTEIFLLILGIAAFVASFVLPERKRGGQDGQGGMTEKQIRNMLEKEMKEVKEQISGSVEETVSYGVEKTERALDRLTNEKIMAVNEYSDTVLEQIHKNHEEVVFLYDMLNGKSDSLKAAAGELEKKAKQAEEDIMEAARKTLQTIQESGKETAFGENAAEDRNKAEDFAPLMPETAPSVMEKDGGEAEAAPVKVPAKKKSSRKTPVKSKKQLQPDKAEEPEKSEVTISFTPPDEGGRNNNEKILTLHKEGKSNMAIARELGLGIGEVKLVIDLFEGM